MARFDPTVDYYALLDVAPDADRATIRRAFRQRAKRVHPDVNPDDPEAARRFRQLRTAQRVLSTPELRRQYDAARRAPPDAAMLPVLTLASDDNLGCVAYYLPRVAIGLMACVLFLVLEALGMWHVDAPWVLLGALTGASGLTGVFAVVVFRWFPDTSDRVSVRMDRRGLKVWVAQHCVARVAWTAVERLTLRPEGPRLELTLTAADVLEAADPVLPQVHTNATRRTAVLDLSCTQVRTTTLRQWLQATDAVPPLQPAAA
ncbi:J domain-containing protein [Salisaeta longa]|uniref:J domain-containing protein n=1 Tax=Salisaeta longa TaxID=503170 RepID=UPI0003B3BB3E|nr:J domain-containing protein [Salisaeta longa]